ncbi:unnamed protein product [Malus baccata var. baccata]
MVEIAIILDILRKKTLVLLRSRHYTLLDYVSSSPSASHRIFEYGFLNNYNTKQHKVELKPLFSAFQWRALAVTIFKSFVLFVVLHPPEPCSSSKDDDDYLPLDNEKEEQHVADYVVPLKKLVKQILRDTTVVTTGQILERISVHYVSRRMACKLLKDVPKPAMRKSGRRLPTVVFIFSVSRATFRGEGLGLAATWLIEVGVEISRFISRMIRSREEDDDDTDLGEQLKLLGKKVSGTSIRCGASLAFGSIGAGIGATLPLSALQWVSILVSCIVGESAGPAIVSYCLGKISQAEP